MPFASCASNVSAGITSDSVVQPFVHCNAPRGLPWMEKRTPGRFPHKMSVRHGPNAPRPPAYVPKDGRCVLSDKVSRPRHLRGDPVSRGGGKKNERGVAATAYGVLTAFRCLVRRGVIPIKHVFSIVGPTPARLHGAGIEDPPARINLGIKIVDGPGRQPSKKSWWSRTELRNPSGAMQKGGHGAPIFGRGTAEEMISAPGGGSPASSATSMSRK